MILTLRINAVALGAGPKMLGLPQLMLKCVDADCSSRTPINYTPSPCPSAVTATRSTLNFPMPATSVVLFPQLLYHPFKNKQLLLISHISPINTFSISMRCVPWNADYQPSHYSQLQRVQILITSRKFHNVIPGSHSSHTTHSVPFEAWLMSQ